MKIDINKLNKLKEDGWLMSQVHPTLPLIIWNYTNKTQWEAYWNEFTLMCRALVTDTEGEVVAHPMKKFFNYSELDAKGQVPNREFRVYKKMDGSLIQLFFYKDQLVLSSRGSFTSIHANYADEILRNKLNNLNLNFLPAGFSLDKNCNYILELIHPDTRIVVDYGTTKDLILLAVIDKNGFEKDINSAKGIFTLAKELIDTTGPIAVDFDALKDLVNNNEEGYVIKFDNGVRMKIKGDEYCRLHRIITMTSSYDIWETLKSNKDITELLERAPDEWLNWLYKTIGEIYVEYKKIHQQVEKDWEYGANHKHNLYTDSRIVTHPNGRRKVAEYFNTCQYPKLMFCKLDGVEYDSKIWELVKPTHSKAFSI